MSDDKIDSNAGKGIAVLFILTGFLAITIALGLMYGAGVGCLFFGLGFLAAAYRIIKILKEQEKTDE